MKKLSRYCKAYSLERLQQYAGWSAIVPNGVNSSDGGSDSQVFLFLHENMIVTTGVFADEDIVFDAVTNEWIEFCTNVLEFRVPDDIANARRETPVGVSHP